MYRCLDFCISLIGLIVLLPLVLVIFILGLFDTGLPLFVQTRVGLKQKPFKLYKFRTMAVDTESVATHLVRSSSVTKLGSVLRTTKLDELPQLLNVLKGDMSLVGPRPCLPNQLELVKARSELRVFDVRPGITGLAQINSIDMSTPELLAIWDARMIKDLSISSYFVLIFKTMAGSGSGDKIGD